MKIITKLKNILLLAGITIMTLPKKVFCNSVKNSGINNVTITGISPEATSYGIAIYEPSDTVVKIWEICKYILIPLVILIGIIIYWKKSKKSTKMKIVGIIIFMLLLIIIGYIAIQIIEMLIDPNGLVL